MESYLLKVCTSFHLTVATPSAHTRSTFSNSHGSFIQIIPEILPARALYLCTDEAFRHPFLQTCCACYIACANRIDAQMSRKLQKEIHGVLERQILIVLRVDPSISIVLGLLVLANVSGYSIENELISGDLFDASTLAYNAAVRLGIHDNAERMNSMTVEELVAPEGRNFVSRTCLVRTWNWLPLAGAESY
jgi:hypothetical protein